MVHLWRGSSAAAGRPGVPARVPGHDAPVAVRTKVIVARPRDHVFDVLARRTGTWWPLGTQSTAPGRAVDLRLDPWPGGRLVEIWDDGSEHPWATVTTWAPPSLLGLAWEAHDDGAVTDVTVRVLEASMVTSWLEVTHDGWAALGAEGHALREGYRLGWAQVLAAFLAGV